jgi:hypothetical protein
MQNLLAEGKIAAIVVPRFARRDDKTVSHVASQSWRGSQDRGPEGRAESKGERSIVFAAPSRISSATASAVAGASRMPQTL